jgi:hypothetical protein
MNGVFAGVLSILLNERETFQINAVTDDPDSLGRYTLNLSHDCRRVFRNWYDAVGEARSKPILEHGGAPIGIIPSMFGMNYDRDAGEARCDNSKKMGSHIVAMKYVRPQLTQPPHQSVKGSCLRKLGAIETLQRNIQVGDAGC